MWHIAHFDCRYLLICYEGFNRIGYPVWAALYINVRDVSGHVTPDDVRAH